MQVCAALCEVVFWGDLRAQEVRLRDDSRLLKTLAVQKLFTPPRKVLRTVQKARASRGISNAAGKRCIASNWCS
jgi:hypothetical protein